MKSLRIPSTLLLLSALSCTNYKYVAVPADNGAAEAYRSTASATQEEQLAKSVEQLTTNIYHSYLMGQEELEKFDAKLDREPESVLESEEYNKLLAIRTLVDHFEEEVGHLYVDLVATTALEDSTPEQKASAQVALDSIGNFFQGVTADGTELPENLKTLILGNLKERQAGLYESLKRYRDDKSITKNSEVRRIFQQNMQQLQSTRKSTQVENYEVDQTAFKAALEAESKKKSFNDLAAQVKNLSKSIKEYRTEAKAGRSTSSDVIYASTSSAGNITGNTFPRNTWALTYDDGPGATTTAQVLSNLQSRGMKATFFVLAKQAEALPTMTKALADAGMDMASHSYTHAQLTKLGAQGLDKEIVTSKKVIESKTGKTVKLFRLPYGAGVSNSTIRTKIAGQNMVHVFWNVDTLDWQDKNPQSIVNRTIKQMNATKNNAGIILFHDIHRQTVTASASIMDHLKKNNARVCTVQGVINQMNKNLASCN